MTFTKEFQSSYPEYIYELVPEYDDMLRYRTIPVPLFLRKEVNCWGFEGCFKYGSNENVTTNEMENLPPKTREFHQELLDTKMPTCNGYYKKIRLVKDEESSNEFLQKFMSCICVGTCTCIPSRLTNKNVKKEEEESEDEVKKLVQGKKQPTKGEKQTKGDERSDWRCIQIKCIGFQFTKSLFFFFSLSELFLCLHNLRESEIHV